MISGIFCNLKNSFNSEFMDDVRCGEYALQQWRFFKLSAWLRFSVCVTLCFLFNRVHCDSTQLSIFNTVCVFDCDRASVVRPSVSTYRGADPTRHLFISYHMLPRVARFC